MRENFVITFLVPVPHRISTWRFLWWCYIRSANSDISRILVEFVALSSSTNIKEWPLYIANYNYSDLFSFLRCWRCLTWSYAPPIYFLQLHFHIGMYSVFNMDCDHFKEFLWLWFWCQVIFSFIFMMEKCVYLHFDFWN